VTDPADNRSALAVAVEQIFRERGAMHVEALVDTLGERGFKLGASPTDGVVEDVLEDEDDLYLRLIDGRWCHLPALLFGRTFTHRLSEVELSYDVLAVTPDLEPVLMLADLPHYEQMVDGTPLQVFFPEDRDESEVGALPVEAIAESGSLPLTHGTLAGLGVTAGDLVGLRLSSAGVELFRAEAEPADESITDLARHVYAQLQQHPDRPQTIETVAYTLSADVPAAFTDPLPPLQELLARWELPTEDGLVGPPGFDFAMWQVEVKLKRLRQRYELTDDEALAVAAVTSLHKGVFDLLEAYTTLEESGDNTELAHVLNALRETAAGPNNSESASERQTIGATLPFLAEPAVVQAVFSETGLRGPRDAAALGLLAESLEPQAGRRVHPALRWLRAKAQEELGETVVAEQVLRDAERLDPNWAPTVVDLARYANDRGEAAAGLALLGRIGDEAPELLRAVLEEHRPEPAQLMPRNQPCWCGSGRKFKHCHLRQADRPPLPERAGWLYQKAILHVLASSWIHLADELGQLRTANIESEMEARTLVHDGLIIDVTLFEGGAFDDFVERRGTLLPADELLLAQQWQLTVRSVFDVTAVSPGSSLTLRDVRTGDVIEVSERTASREVRRGQLICTHLLPTGDGHRIFGGIDPVGLHEREALIELLDDNPQPEEVVASCSRRFAPPGLANTEGHPLMLCRADLRSADPQQLALALDRAYRREEADTDEPSVARWVEIVNVDGMDRIRAELQLVGDELTITANSETRQDAALARVRELQSSITLVARERTPLRNAREAVRLANTLPASQPQLPALEDLPEVRATVAEHIRSYEEQWVDLPIPALDGRTPREAAEDPTRREDLIRLLAGFRDTDDPTMMSPSRLRAALRLPAS
jgi:hypothetical protein